MTVATYYVLVNNVCRIQEIIDESYPIFETANAAITLNTMLNDPFSKNILIEKIKEIRDLLAEGAQHLVEVIGVIKYDKSADNELLYEVNTAYNKSVQAVNQLDETLISLNER